MVDVSQDDQLRDAIEALYFGYRAFTDQADRILASRGLGRVHHRILYFIGQRPGVSVSGLLGVLGVSKQALNAPLRLLIEMRLVETQTALPDRRVKKLWLTGEGMTLEAELTSGQRALLGSAFAAAGSEASRGWMDVMKRLSGDMPEKSES